jgi:hypothetical protein
VSYDVFWGVEKMDKRAKQAPVDDFPPDWHGSVYRKGDPLGDDWHAIAREVIARDHNRCMDCHGRKLLTVHHIIPRENGGGNNMENLVTLCAACHDIREQGFTLIDKKEKKIEPNEVIDPDDWHTWVYGGGRNPKK